MSTFVLQLPNNFVDVDTEEMEYVDGGGTLTINVSRDFLRDVFTATSTGVATVIGYAIAAAVVSASGGTLSPFASVIASAAGGAVGWILGGVYSRSQINSGMSFSVYIPIISDKTLYIS